MFLLNCALYDKVCSKLMVSFQASTFGLAGYAAEAPGRERVLIRREKCSALCWGSQVYLFSLH